MAELAPEFGVGEAMVWRALHADAGSKVNPPRTPSGQVASLILPDDTAWNGGLSLP
jgi:hypothetical protein